MPAHRPQAEKYIGVQRWQDNRNGVSPEARGPDPLGGSLRVTKRELHTNSPGSAVPCPDVSP